MKKRLISAIIGATISMNTFMFASEVNTYTYAANLVYGDFKYIIDDNHEITIIGYNGNSANVNIPQTIDNKKVTQIGKCAFEENMDIINVQLPETITKINYKAFAECRKLETINFPNSLEVIDEHAFTTCHNLKEIKLGSNLKKIGTRAFQLCISLTEITIPGNIKTIVNHAFHGCHSLETLTIQEGVEEIESTAALNLYSARRIILPESVTSIGEHALGYYYYDPDYIRFDTTIYGYADTAAEKYANANGFDFIELIPYGDVNSDNTVDALDASLILAEYANISTSKVPSFDDKQTSYGDVDKNNTINALDASKVLSYYAYKAAGGEEEPVFYFFGWLFQNLHAYNY